MLCKYCGRVISIGQKYYTDKNDFRIMCRVRKRHIEGLPECHGYMHNSHEHKDPAGDSMKDYDWIPLRMNVLTENNSIVVLADEMHFYNIETDGSITNADQVREENSFEYYPFDNFYVHSGASEMITYNTIGQEGQIIEVNRFKAVNPNPGIKRVNGTKG